MKLLLVTSKWMETVGTDVCTCVNTVEFNGYRFINNPSSSLSDFDGGAPCADWNQGDVVELRSIQGKDVYKKVEFFFVTSQQGSFECEGCSIYPSKVLVPMLGLARAMYPEIKWSILPCDADLAAMSKVFGAE